MAKRNREIRGLVAKILDSRSLVINKGSNDGVAKTMVFEVLDKNATKIIDPETKENLGSIDRPKVRVRVVDVSDRLAIAETFETYTYNRGGMGGFPNISRMLAAPDYVKKVETLRSEEKEWDSLPEERSYVKVGDPVRQINLDIKD